MILSIPKQVLLSLAGLYFYSVFNVCKTSAQEISGKQLLEKQSITTILRATGSFSR
jgi:hypothetical protein